MSNVWENVADDEDNLRTERLRVPGGWLYRTSRLGFSVFGVAMVFVPDVKE